MVRDKKHVHKNKVFIEAAIIAVETYIKLFDLGKDNSNNNTAVDKDINNNLAKKNKITNDNKNKKDADKKEQTNTRNTAEKKGKTGFKAEKFDPKELEKTDKPLAEAVKFLDQLQLAAASEARVQHAAANLYARETNIWVANIVFQEFFSLFFSTLLYVFLQVY